jgi:hypothetical protein
MLLRISARHADALTDSNKKVFYFADGGGALEFSCQRNWRKLKCRDGARINRWVGKITEWRN